MNGGIPGHMFNHAASAAWCSHGLFTDVLVQVDLEQKTRSSRSPRKQQAPFKLPKRSSTGTAKSLCGIENHCKVCLTSTLRTLSSRKTKLTTPEEHCCVLCL
ncbi:uncharacterized protein LOC142814766 isoform X1 [Rhipicephalus microplus]|uniref:uncharacterized protein LOC142814766 isoform X1 n=1 Tax=Rhipicephalus microplus TaxID=6941 RepID=UPI003F6BDAE6